MRRFITLLAVLALALHGMGLPRARSGEAALRIPVCTARGIVLRVVDGPAEPRGPVVPPCCRFGLCCGLPGGAATLPGAPAVALPVVHRLRRRSPPTWRTSRRRRPRAHPPRAPPRSVVRG